MFLLLSYSIFQGFQSQGKQGWDTPLTAFPSAHRQVPHPQGLG
jgi:hypothetical protein